MARSMTSLLLLLVCLDAVSCYPTGPPTSVCSSMAPNTIQHGANPQTSPPPYNVTINVPAGGAKTGESYTVSITANPDTTFKGFMCQVRVYNTSGTSAIGSFTSFDTGKAKNLVCTSNTGAVVHKNSNIVSSFSAIWAAPSSVSGDTKLIAFCTIVQVRTIYWVQVPSSPFTLSLTMSPTIVTPTGGSSVVVASFTVLFLGLLLQLSFS